MSSLKVQYKFIRSQSSSIKEISLDSEIEKSYNFFNTSLLRWNRLRYITLQRFDSVFDIKIHRLENREKNPLEIIEIQTGNYLGEDDIIRLEDDYKRN
jgi:hypothetical protein